MYSKIRSNVRKYDIRGRVGAGFGKDEAYLIGKAFATVLLNLDKKSVVVGHDVRPSSKDLSDSLVRGLLESGINVIDCGLCITPMVRFASLLCDSHGSIMVTASHNDFSDNGFKFFLDKKPYYDDSLNRLCDIIDAGNFFDGVGTLEEIDFADLYIRNIVKRISVNNKLRAVWIYDNDFMKFLLSKLVQMIPGQHLIAPELPKGVEYDVGFEFDTDGDRMILIDKDGKRICGDETLALFVVNMKKNTSKLKAIFDLKASRVLIKWLESVGVDCEICQIGSCYLDQKLRKTKADIGGEVSGHFMFKDYNSFSDDGVYSACLMLQYLSDFGSIRAMRSGLPEVHVSKLIRIKCPLSTNKFELIQKIKTSIGENKIVNDNAIIVQMQEGWIVIRPSETEHMITVRCEGFYKDGLQIVQEKADSLLSIVGLSIW